MCQSRIPYKLIHSANPKSRPVGIIVFAHVVRPSKHFKSIKTKQQKTMFATGVTMGLAEWIIDDTCLVCVIFEQIFIVQKGSPPLCKFPHDINAFSCFDFTE